MVDFIQTENSVIKRYYDMGDGSFSEPVSNVYPALSYAIDPVQKLRVTQPQALIDTDFEYGLQPTKWEHIFLQNNRQSFFYDPTTFIAVTAITGAGTRTVTVATANPPTVGSAIYIQNSLNANANGWFYVTSSVASTSFTYTASANVTGALFDTTKTYVFQGRAYSNCGIPLAATTAFTYSANTITCTTSSAHGLYVGSAIYVFNTTATTNAPNGAWIVTATPTANTFRFSVVDTPTGTIGNVANNTTLYARPTGIIESRPYDGGVSFSAGSSVIGGQMIRQTRRYFRYQSGKGIQFSTGTILKPPLFTTSLTSDVNTVTVTTRFVHNIGVGSVISVSGCTPSTFNGTFTVLAVPTPTTLTYTVTNIGTQTATGLPIRVSPVSWYGSSNKVGIFDQQNGMFFEFDGQTLNAVRRSSILQLNGTVTCTFASPVVTGIGTQFASQLEPGDFIVLRGSSYKVQQINSDTQLLITPEYKGTTASSILVSKTIDLKVPQSQWTDPCDGTGLSKYNIDLTRIQMFYIDYSWYGAGIIRMGFRVTDGSIVYVHSFVHNNSQYEAYMRSGNLPSHYESSTLSTITYLKANLLNTELTTLAVNSTNGFPPTGTVAITANGATGAIEYVAYADKTADTFTGLTRAQTGASATAQTFNYSPTAFVSVELIAPETAAAMSHWGSSVLMDGRFDDDKSLVFNTGMTTSVSVASGATQPLISIRLAPSVDSGFTGILGAREIINRMQLKPDSMSLLANGPFLIQVRLNGRVSGGTFASAGGSSLAQIATHTSGQTITAGENASAFYADSSGTSQVLTMIDLNKVRDLGNSILGGGTDNLVPTTTSNLYPDGPDVVTITVTNIGTGNQSVLARLSWTEAQA